MSTKSKNPGGFTLTELVVSIGIIAVLLTLLFSAVSQARASARKVNCASNLYQVWIAYSSYAAVNNSRLPLNTYGADLYWITNLSEMQTYGLTAATSDCTDMEVWPRTGGAPGMPGSWNAPYVPQAGTQMVPLGYGNYIFRSGGYTSGTGVVRVPEASMYKTVNDPPRMMFGGQTPTPLFTCFAVHEGTGWNTQPTAQVHEPQPMHGFRGINSLQMGGSVYWKPYPGSEIYDPQGAADVVKFYQFPGDWGGMDAMAY
jgi:prepilin-type N-terminal cleavage/methylation domain-containing protein